MAYRLTKPDHINVLLSDADWAWPQAVTQIFRPRGINALLASKPGDMIHIVLHNKIHLAILDGARDGFIGVQTIKMLRKHDKLFPCILLAQDIDDRLLSQALNLNVFSVINKPVDLSLLAQQVNRIFQKCYATNIFYDENGVTSPRRNLTDILRRIKRNTSD